MHLPEGPDLGHCTLNYNVGKERSRKSTTASGNRTHDVMSSCSRGMRPTAVLDYCPFFTMVFKHLICNYLCLEAYSAHYKQPPFWRRPPQACSKSCLNCWEAAHRHSYYLPQCFKFVSFNVVMSNLVVKMDRNCGGWRRSELFEWLPNVIYRLWSLELSYHYVCN